MTAKRNLSRMLCAMTLPAGAVLLAPALAEATTLVRNDFSNMNDGLSFVGATNLDGSAVLPVQGQRADYASSGQYEQDSGAWVFSTKLEGRSGQAFAWNRPGGSAGKGIGDAYDHDNDPATANVAIPGGIEVNGWNMSGQPGLVTITVTTPEAIGAGDGVITFSAAFRYAATYGVNGTVRIWDATQGVDLLPETTVLNSGFVTDADNTVWDFRGEWKFNQFATTGSAAAGDEIQVIFNSGTAQGDAGMSLTDITFQSVPEPTSLGLIGLGALALLKRRH